MSEGLVGTSIASGAGSLVAYACLVWWKKRKDRTKLCGAVLPLGKSYAEQNLVDDEHLVFIDLDGSISTTPVTQVDKSKIRLELYPKAKEVFDKNKEQFKNKKIVFCSSSYELLKYIGIKPKRIHLLAPNQKFMVDNKDVCPTIDFKALELNRLHQELEVPSNVRHYYSDFSEMTRKLVNIFRQIN